MDNYTLPRLMYITHPIKDYPIVEQVEAVCKGGCRWVQLRLKNTPDEVFIKTAFEVQHICKHYKTLLTINDSVYCAQAIQADGCHLGQEDMDILQGSALLGREVILGYTCNTNLQVTQALRLPINYIGLGPLWHKTETKTDMKPFLGYKGYENIIGSIKNNLQASVPIIAIGGIEDTDIEPLLKIGVHGFAISSAIRNATDPTEKTKHLLQILSQYSC
ncbi:MAG: thiamine phosphate synthase [Phycisphaerales bacterium]|nr:thiamine phosphate synthase [Phycisphaerales bacterium]